MPLDLGDEVAYFSNPRQMNGLANPLIAGGMRASMNDYAAFLALLFHRGHYRGLTVGTPALYDAQASEPFPAAIIASSPIARLGLPYRYGLAAWLECEPPAWSISRCG